jgi:hypothetical protein
MGGALIGQGGEGIDLMVPFISFGSVLGVVRTFFTGAGGFEPTNVGTKNRCLTTWRRPIFQRLISVYNYTIFICFCQINSPL